MPVQLRLHSAQGSETRRHLLSDRQTRFPVPPDLDWVVANAGGNGFYRVRYSPELFTQLLAHLGELSPLERFNLLDDSWALTEAGLLPIAEYLNLTEHYQSETDRNVWTVLLRSLRRMLGLLEPDQEAPFAAFVRTRLADASRRLGYQPAPGEDELTRQLRGELLQTLGTLGMAPEVQGWAERVYSAATPEADLDPELRRAALIVRARTGDEALYEEYFQRYETHPDPQEQDRALSGLLAFRPEPLVRRNLERTLNGRYRIQDAPYQMRSLLALPHSRGLAWEHLKTHWPEMREKYPEMTFQSVWRGTVHLVRPQWEQEVREYVEQVELDLGSTLLQQYLERLHAGVVMYQRDSGPLGDYLSSRFGSS